MPCKLSSTAKLTKSIIVLFASLLLHCSNDLDVLLQMDHNSLAMLSIGGSTPCDASNADLSNLTLSSGALTPSFATGTFSYSATVSASSITVTPTAASSCSTIEVNGIAVTSGSPSGSINTPSGTTFITVVVTSGDMLTTNTYNVDIYSCYSNNADLSDITISTGALSPAFASGTTSYTTSVNVSSITVTPTAADSCSTILVNGVAVASGNPSGSINTPAGTTTVTVQVTAGDGLTTKTYTIGVSSTYSTDAGLSNLVLSSGALAPSFATGTYSYTSTVNVSSITVTPTASDSYASITVNGTPVPSGNPSGSIGTPEGATIITVIVTAGDGLTTKTYTVTVTSCYSTDADLSGLTISSGALTPAFASGTTSYTTSVNVASITVTPTAADSCSTILVNGIAVASGNPSGSINTPAGTTTVTVQVTAGDGLTTKTYTIGVSSTYSTDAGLSNLVLSSGALTPSFATGTYSYTSTVNVSSITVTPTASDSYASITVNGTPVPSGNPSGSIATPEGTTIINVEVTAGDGLTTNTYTVDVSSCYSTDADLSNLTISSGALTPAFASGTTSYTDTVSVSLVTVTPTAANSCATITVNGTSVASGSPSGDIAIPLGSTPISVVVTAGDGLTTNAYTITASRSAILPCDFTSNKPITLDTTITGAGVSSDVSDFPVLIRVTDPAIIDAVHSGAPDLRFRNKNDDAWLDYEIERWDQANDLAEVWVLVPTVSGDTSEVALTMYYDDVSDGSISDGQCATCVFDTANNVYGAWHLNEDPSGGTVYDRTTNSYDGTPASMDAGNLVDGLIGKGLSFDGSSEYIDIATTQTDRDNITNSSAYTISAWLKGGAQSDSRSIVDFSVASGNAYVGIGFGYDGYPSYDGQGFSWHSDDSSVNANHYNVMLNTPVVDDGSWHYIVMTRNGTNFALYIDGGAGTATGTTETSSSSTVGATTTTNLQFGRNPFGGGMQYFNGTLDETRIFSTNVSADWVKLSFENQKSSQTLVSY